jgi:predicted small secreted protein
MPILLGGDHCLGIGSITAVARHCRAHRKLRVLWLDAHADFNTSQITPSGNVHGMPVACLCGLGPRPLKHLGGSAPACAPTRSARSASARSTRREAPGPGAYGLDIYDMRYIDEVGMKRAMEEALEGPDADTHLHVSFDVDFLDPQHRARRRHHRARRPELPRGAIGDGDDRRHRPAWARSTSSNSIPRSTMATATAGWRWTWSKACSEIDADAGLSGVRAGRAQTPAGALHCRLLSHIEGGDPMKRNLAILLLALLSATVLGGCNTIEGAGKDIQKAGEKVEGAAKG